MTKAALVRVGRAVSSINERIPGNAHRREDAVFDDLLARLPENFADPSAADSWVNNALRLLCERLAIDRAEVFWMRGNEMCIERVWPLAARDTQVLLLERPETVPWLVAQLRSGARVSFAGTDELPEEARAEREFCARHGIAALLAMPLRGAGEVAGVLCLTSALPHAWPDRIVGRIQSIGQAIGATLTFASSRRALAEVRAESERLRQRLDGEILLRPNPDLENDRREIVGRSASISAVLQKVAQVAPTNTGVLLLGETGTGKELVARAIHNASQCRSRSMVKVNCASLPATLVENELFGREKGAYTGALSRQAGRFEVADGSTIFLDEIGELSPEVQVKLLRVLQDGEFERIGSTTTQRVKVRVIAATNRDLGRAVRDGRFREDLFYRLNVFPIRIPPLRDRREDIPALVWAFVEEFGRSMGHQVERISRSSMDALQGYSWPGNVRELRNVIERAMIVHREPTLHVEIPEIETADRLQGLALEEVERRHVLSVLQAAGWRVRGKTGAAEILGLKPTTLESRLAKLGIRRPTLAAGGTRPLSNHSAIPHAPSPKGTA